MGHQEKLSYLFSIITAIIYGFMLDGALWLIGMLPYEHMFVKILSYVFGMLLCSLGVSLLFHTYISPEAYELFVKELSLKFNKDIHKFKTIYDCASCLISVVLSFAFFGLWEFKGINVGTAIGALINGALIHLFTRLLKKFWTFEDRLTLRKYFQ